VIEADPGNLKQTLATCFVEIFALSTFPDQRKCLGVFLRYNDLIDIHLPAPDKRRPMGLIIVLNIEGTHRIGPMDIALTYVRHDLILRKPDLVVLFVVP
jgi:hypothetical protein